MISSFVVSSHRRSTAPGVWYKVMGTGLTLRVSTCLEDVMFGDLDTVLTVYTGCDAASATCVASNDQFCSNQSTVEFPTVAGEEYYILVYGFFSSDVGPFELTVTEIVPPENDLCQNAISIDLDSTTTGTIASATVDDSFEGCPFAIRCK